MSEKPIIFKDEMVRAILDGRKTQTRRIANGANCPFGGVGDSLWVRECWAHTTDYDGQYLLDGVKALYRSDCSSMITPSRWRPSIHMPRWASRITLPIKSVSAERLQDITPEDAIAEGIGRSVKGNFRNYSSDFTWYSDPRESFRTLWDSINGKRDGCRWSDNPNVWRVEWDTYEVTK